MMIPWTTEALAEDRDRLLERLKDLAPHWRRVQARYDTERDKLSDEAWRRPLFDESVATVQALSLDHPVVGVRFWLFPSACAAARSSLRISVEYRGPRYVNTDLLPEDFSLENFLDALPQGDWNDDPLGD